MPPCRGGSALDCVLDCVREWFGHHGWEPFSFQEKVWRRYLSGESGLIHAATMPGPENRVFVVVEGEVVAVG
jgi:hypothetical protein